MAGCTKMAPVPTIPATPTLSSIAVTPNSPHSLAVGSTEQLTATGTYSDGSTADISSQVTWSSDTPATATIANDGLATGVAAGTANITATLDEINSPSVLLIVVSLSSIAVTPNPPANLGMGATQQFTATGTYSDGSTADISSQVTWSSDTPATATIGNDGLATGVAVGTANITATLDEITSPSVLVKVLLVSKIAVTPNPPGNLGVGATEQFTATGTFSDGSTADISSQVGWYSDNWGIATTDPTGLATGVAVGTANITATLGSITSPAVVLTVVSLTSTTSTTTTATPTTTTSAMPTTAPTTTASSPATTKTGLTLSSIAVLPSSPIGLTVGSGLYFTAKGTYSDGSIANITSQVTWASSNIAIATISSAGLAKGVAVGTANITAALAGVTSPPVSLPVVSPSSTTPTTPTTTP
jgi:uncharacterized protein YjdB